MKRQSAILIVVFALACAIITPFVIEMASAQNSTSLKQVDAQLTVHVLDIDLTKKTAIVAITVTIIDYPVNETSLSVRVIGGGDVTIDCKNIAPNAVNNWWFQGTLNETIWFLGGAGETFPFDSYILYFSVPYDSFDNMNCTVAPAWSQAFFNGPKLGQLRDQWFENDSHCIPLNWYPITQKSSFVYGENSTNRQMGVSIQRSSDASNTAILEFIAPIIGCYYVLVASLLLTLNNLTERLTIYLAIFVFVPTFFIGIQTYLPYRASLSFPELLLANLVISTTVLTVFSIIGKHGWAPLKIKTLEKLKIHHSNWDLLAIFFCLSFFLLTYSITLIDKISQEASFMVFYLLLPAYFIWFPIENMKEFSFRSDSFKHSLKIFAIISLTIMFLFIGTFFLNDFRLVLLGGCFTGVITGIYLVKIAKSAILGLLGGLFGTLLTGIFASIYFPIYKTMDPVKAIIEGITNNATAGYPIGLYAALGGFTGAFVLQWHLDRKAQKAVKKRMQMGERRLTLDN